MGNHFVPQAYLRGFQDPANPDFIWVQSRREQDPRSASIEDVAQSRNFYDPEIEKLLASSVEGPANPVLAKLRAGELPTDQERVALAVYLATMIKRVPKNRARGRRWRGRTGLVFAVQARGEDPPSLAGGSSSERPNRWVGVRQRSLGWVRCSATATSWRPAQRLPQGSADSGQRSPRWRAPRAMVSARHRHLTGP